jgi:ribosomal protein L25 (general stress protein Ctc)
MGKWRSTKGQTDIRRFSKNGRRPRVLFSDDTPRKTSARRAEGERKWNDEG